MHRSSDPDTPVAEPVALAGLLARVHGELLDLGRCADDLQAVIGAIVAGLPARLDASALVQLQAADALSQRLDRLAQLADILGARVPTAWTVDPRADADLAHALSRLAGGAPAQPVTEAEGQCEFF